jgi:hypothetical protein
MPFDVFAVSHAEMTTSKRSIEKKRIPCLYKPAISGFSIFLSPISFELRQAYIVS